MAVQVPLAALRDFDFPINDHDQLLINEAAPVLKHAAELWLVNEAQFFANNEALTKPRIQHVLVTAPADSDDDLFSLVNTDQQTIWRHLNATVIYEFDVSAEQRISVASHWYRLGLRTQTSITYVNGDRRHDLEFTNTPALVHLDPSLLTGLQNGFSKGLKSVSTDWFLLIIALALFLPLGLRPGLLSLVTFLTATVLTSHISPVPGWTEAAFAAAIALGVIYVCLENVLGFNLAARTYTSALFVMLVGAALGVLLQPSLQFSGYHTHAAALSAGLGSFMVLLIVAGITRLLWDLADTRKTVLGWVIAIALAHTAWHQLETAWDTIYAYHDHG